MQNPIFARISFGTDLGHPIDLLQVCACACVCQNDGK